MGLFDSILTIMPCAKCRRLGWLELQTKDFDSSLNSMKVWESMESFQPLMKEGQFEAHGIFWCCNLYVSYQCHVENSHIIAIDTPVWEDHEKEFEGRTRRPNRYDWLPKSE